MNDIISYCPINKCSLVQFWFVGNPWFTADVPVWFRTHLINQPFTLCALKSVVVTNVWMRCIVSCFIYWTPLRLPPLNSRSQEDALTCFPGTHDLIFVSQLDCTLSSFLLICSYGKQMWNESCVADTCLCCSICKWFSSFWKSSLSAQDIFNCLSGVRHREQCLDWWIHCFWSLNLLL